jgi:hypothetical protein
MRKNNKLLHKYEFKILFNGMVIREQRETSKESTTENNEEQE